MEMKCKKSLQANHSLLYLSDRHEQSVWHAGTRVRLLLLEMIPVVESDVSEKVSSSTRNPRFGDQAAMFQRSGLQSRRPKMWSNISGGRLGL